VKVSILIPTFNRLALLTESLESARRQTYSNLEILVSDNGSTDRTREFVEGIAAGDRRVRLLPLRASPQMFSNFNYLIEQSAGDAFCLLADDDRLLPDYAEQLVGPLAGDKASAVSFCDHWIISAEGARLAEGSDRHSHFYGRASLAPGRVADPIAVVLRQTMSVMFAMYRSSVFRNTRFDLACGGAADVDFAIRAARAGELFYVDRRLAEYRAHASTVTATRTSFMLDGAMHAYGKHTFDNPVHEGIRRSRLRAGCRAKAVYACTRNRREWWESVQRYRQSGGSLARPAILLSCALAALPHQAAETVRGCLKGVRAVAKPRPSQ